MKEKETEELLERLTVCLRSNNSDVAYNSIRALGDIPDPRASQALVDLLRDICTGQVRWTAGEAG